MTKNMFFIYFLFYLYKNQNARLKRLTDSQCLQEPDARRISEGLETRDAGNYTGR